MATDYNTPLPRVMTGPITKLTRDRFFAALGSVVLKTTQPFGDIDELLPHLTCVEKQVVLGHGLIGCASGQHWDDDGIFVRMSLQQTPQPYGRHRYSTYEIYTTKLAKAIRGEVNVVFHARRQYVPATLFAEGKYRGVKVYITVDMHVKPKPKPKPRVRSKPTNRRVIRLD